MMPKFAARRDGNHGEIESVFRSLGFSWLDTTRNGGGAGDAFAAKHNNTAMIEIKDAKLPPSKRKLRESQRGFHASWKGKIFVVESVNDAVVAANDPFWTR